MSSDNILPCRTKPPEEVVMISKGRRSSERGQDDLKKDGMISKGCDGLKKGYDDPEDFPSCLCARQGENESRHERKISFIPSLHSVPSGARGYDSQIKSLFEANVNCITW